MAYTPPPHTPPEDFNLILPDHSPETAKQLGEAINLLRKSGATIDIETLLLVLFKNILAGIAEEMDEELDIAQLTPRQEEKLAEVLEQIAKQLQQAGLVGQNEHIKKLVRLLIRSRQPQKPKEYDEDGKEKEDENEYESLAPAEKKRLQKLFQMFAVYEAYKITNPNQLAGETRLDNFIHNLALRGKDFAIHKTGSDMGMTHEETEKIVKQQHSFVQAIQDFNKGKDTGWSR